ncbi:HlyD family efflux transporter periplasmic adaptor subunit [Enterococcus italicus]
MKKKWLIWGSVLIVLLGGAGIWYGIKYGGSSDSKANTPSKEELEITYFDVPEMDQVYINGKVQPEQSQAYILGEEKKSVPTLKVQNGQVVDAGTVLYEVEDPAVTSEIENQTNALTRQANRKNTLYGKWNRAIDQWKKTSVEERTTTKEELDNQFQTELDTILEEEQYINETLADLNEKQIIQTTADFKGKVAIPEVKEANTPIMRLISETLYVAGTVNEKDLEKIQVNQKANLTIVSNGTTLSGHIQYIDANPPEQNSEASGDGGQATNLSSYKVKLSIDEPEKVKNGYHIQAAINVGEETPIFIPTAAIHQEGETSYVLVNDFGSVIRKAIVLAEEEGETTHIVSGLEAGDRIIVSSKTEVKEGDVIDTTSTDIE